ncbi:MAG: EAL domain-containing protein [Pirellulaceae bacterium]
MEKATPLKLSPAAWFFVGNSDDTGGARNVAITTPFRIGRSSEADLTLPSRSVSGIHAKILEEGGELWLHDLGSTNGTFVNGERITKVCLRDGDTVQFAAVVFQVSNASNSVNISGEVRTPGEAHEEAVETLQKLQFERLFSGGVVPFFQPIVRIDQDSQVIEGFEVLGRSRLFGLRTPKQMFEAASRMEMEAELSRVLRRQGIELAETSLPQHLTLFVNTHPAELLCDGLIESLQEIRETCPRRPITLEVHESVLNETAKIAGLRSALQELDIALAFDDFGAGQSRLFELSEVTPDVLKFDVKLIQGIDKAPSKRQHFVASLVKMVAELGITPLAECVEGKDEHETLRQLGFQLGQGFFYGKPASLPDCVSSIGSQPVCETGEPPVIREQAPTPEPLPSPEPKSQPQRPMVQSFLESPSGNSAVHSVAKDAAWLLQQPANHYTIQVLSAISKERAEEHVAAQQNPQDFAIFCKPGKTRMLYIVVFGVFEDRSTAKAATANFSSAAVSPWIRMLSGVHSEIRNHQR